MIIRVSAYTGVVPWFVLLKGHPIFNQKSTEYMKKVHIFARVVHELSKILLDLKINFFLHLHIQMI